MERARFGARLLAAAATLAQEPTVQVPDGAANAKGISVQAVLPDWDERDQAALLSRPIFDEAIYGTVRFHHRSVREYLSAEWFAELLSRETSRRTIESLFFQQQYGLDIIVPKLRPVLPWLAILDEKIRERVRKVAPEIIFEGGDPSQLPLEVRRYTLLEVCEQMADGVSGRSVQDYAAVQRFSNLDLADDVRELIKNYLHNDELTAFLLRMVWLGQLAAALPEAMGVALMPTTERYARIAAFRAIKAIGSPEDLECIRQSFLSEAPDLKRQWLSELLEGLVPTERTLAWLIASLERSEAKEQYSVDHLAERVTEFAGAADLALLPRLVAALDRLLSLPPVIENRFCEVSKKFQWLMTAAAKAVGRMILARQPAALESDALAVLHKISAVRGYGTNNLSDIKAEFTKLVPDWRELNRALFWFEVQRSREALDKKRGERLTESWQVSILGSFWRFGEEDFGFFAGEIAGKPQLDDKLVALSVAFRLYREADRPRQWRQKLKKQSLGSSALTERLGLYLKPPAQGQEASRWKRQEGQWKRRDKTRQRRQEKYHARWKEYLSDHLEEMRLTLRDRPGILTSALLYLFERTRNENHSSGRWTEYNWKGLIPEFGEPVARFYRDGAVTLWRHYEPKIRLEGAPLNQTPYAVVIGLIGLEIEANETNDWPANLDVAEVERACRFASFELNGFPTWLPKLFDLYPAIVGGFLMQEIRYELSIEVPEADTSYVISDVSWSGQWAWDLLAPEICDLLKAREPANSSNLDKLLKVLQGSFIPDDQLENLALRKCRTLTQLDHLARWFAVWTGVAPDAAIPALKKRIAKLADTKERTRLAMTFATYLCGSRLEGTAVRQAFKTPEHLKSLYLLIHEHIRREEDIDRAGSGVYSPGLRDNAQEARNGLFELLNGIPGKESFLALMEIAKSYPKGDARPWMMRHAKSRAEQDGDIEPWEPAQVRDFHEKLDRTPRNHRELAELAAQRLLDLKDDLERGDSSVAGILQAVTQETAMRTFMGRELREKAFGRYSIPQEEEFADAKRPDLRFHGVGFDGPVTAELKVADKWTGPALFERLENQLCGDYLRDNRSNRGIFVLVNRGAKAGWDIPSGGNRVDFEGLVAALVEHWAQISAKYPKIDDIAVIGIDLAKRKGAARAFS